MGFAPILNKGDALNLKNVVSRRAALQTLALASVAPIAGAQTASRTARTEKGAAASPAATRAWPTQPIRLLVGFPPGSVQDLSARVMAPGLAGAFGKPVIVENKAGASGTIAADMVARATDLHTFGVMNNSQLTVAKILTPGIAYDPITDLSPIAMIGTKTLE